MPNRLAFAKFDGGGLEYYLGEKLAGTKMKSSLGWRDNGNGTNESGFNAFPGGCRLINGNFDYVGVWGYWWSSTEYNEINAFGLRLRSSNGGVYKYFDDFKTEEFFCSLFKG